MGISERLSSLRQSLPGASPPQEDERLLQLYWNRAELKKEVSRLQDEQHKLLEGMKKQESATARMREQLNQLEEYLGDPEVASHALIYFQLRSLWRACAVKLTKFANDLRLQQEDRERRRQLLEFDEVRARQLVEFEAKVNAARVTAEVLETQLKVLEARLAAMRGFWHYFRRRRLAEEVEIEREKWDAAATQVTDLSDDHAAIELSQPPAFAGLSIEGRRGVNTAVIAYAQALVASLSQGGLAMLAKETTARRAFDARYGGRDDCARLMALLREAVAMVTEVNDGLSGLRQRIESLRASAAYRNDADAVPMSDSIGALPAPAAVVPGLQVVSRSGINVLIDDYWNIGKVLME
jgi:chromosome segregation ATPase